MNEDTHIALRQVKSADRIWPDLAPSICWISEYDFRMVGRPNMYLGVIEKLFLKELIRFAQEARAFCQNNPATSMNRVLSKKPSFFAFFFNAQ